MNCQFVKIFTYCEMQAVLSKVDNVGLCIECRPIGEFPIIVKMSYGSSSIRDIMFEQIKQAFITELLENQRITNTLKN